MNEGLTPEQLNLVLDLARTRNAIILLYPCRNACCFCINIQKGPLLGMPNFFTNLPSKEDLKKIVDSLDFTKNIQVDMCDNFEFPFIYDLLEMLYERQLRAGSKAKIWILSTFSRFDPLKVNLLKKIETLYVDMALMTFDTKFKNTIMGGGWAESQTETTKKVIRAAIPDNIAVWYFGDLTRLKQDLDTLASLLDDEKLSKIALGLNYPHSTKYSNRQTKELAEKAVSTLDKAITFFLD